MTHLHVCLTTWLIYDSMTWLIYDSMTCAHDFFIWPTTWLIYTYARTQWRVCTWLLHMCDMTHPRVRYEWLTPTTCLIYTHDRTQSRVWTWLIYICDCDMTHTHDMTHLHVRQGIWIRLVHTWLSDWDTTTRRKNKWLLDDTTQD